MTWIVAANALLVWALMIRNLVKLEVELYAMQTVAAVYRATEELAYAHAENDLAWLRGSTASDIKGTLVMMAYRHMPPTIGLCPAWTVRAFYGEQGFCDLVERQYEKARRMSIDVMDRKDDVKIDLD